MDEPEHGIAYIYLHLEHLSKEDPLISFRMVQYCVKIIDRHIKNHEAKKIPLIFPTVLYNGKRPFSDAVSIFDLFGENKELAREYMFDRFHLVDLSTIPDKEIRQHQWSCLLEMIFKHVRSRDIMTLLEEITDIFQQFVQKNAEDHVKAMLKYVIEKASIKDRQKFLTWVVKKLPKELEKEAMTLAEQWKSEGIQIGVQQGIKEAMTLAEQWKREGIQIGVQQGIKEAMTLAEQWKSEGIQIGVQQGVQQGIQQGVQQGIQQGTLEGERIILKKQLKWRFSSIPEKYLNKIDNANTKQLELFARKFLEAKTLEDIFGSYH